MLVESPEIVIRPRGLVVSFSEGCTSLLPPLGPCDTLTESGAMVSANGVVIDQDVITSAEVSAGINGSDSCRVAAGRTDDESRTGPHRTRSAAFAAGERATDTLSTSSGTIRIFPGVHL
jgi:hypothetical protein